MPSRVFMPVENLAAFTEKYGLSAQIMLGLLRPFLGPYQPFRVDPR